MPAATVDAAVSVKVDVPEPGAATDAGLNAAVTPEGSPEALRATAELKPPETTVVMAPIDLAPGATETEVGEAERVNAVAVTESETVAVCVKPPPVPVTVIV